MEISRLIWYTDVVLKHFCNSRVDLLTVVEVSGWPALLSALWSDISSAYLSNCVGIDDG